MRDGGGRAKPNNIESVFTGTSSYRKRLSRFGTTEKTSVSRRIVKIIYEALSIFTV